MKAGFLLSLTEPALRRRARRGCSTTPSRWAARAPARERAHLAATRLVLEGRWHDACRAWDALLRRASARRAGAAVGAPVRLLPRRRRAACAQRPARALPEWDEDDPLLPLRARACTPSASRSATSTRRPRRRGRAALPARCARAVGDARGGARDGDAGPPRGRRGLAAPAAAAVGFGRQRLRRPPVVAPRAVSPRGAGCAGRAAAARRAPRGRRAADHAAAARRGVAAVAPAPARARMSSARCRALVDAWPFDGAHARPLRLQRPACACWRWPAPASWRAPTPGSPRCAGRALDPSDARRANHAMAREVGLPLMRGLLALARGDHDAAAELMQPVRGAGAALRRQPRAARPDRPDAAGRLRAAGAAIARSAARCSTSGCMAKPATPLTRFWSQRLGVCAAWPA